MIQSATEHPAITPARLIPLAARTVDRGRPSPAVLPEMIPPPEKIRETRRKGKRHFSEQLPPPPCSTTDPTRSTRPPFWGRGERPSGGCHRDEEPLTAGNAWNSFCHSPHLNGNSRGRPLKWNPDAMEVTVDDYGRIVIPKSIRDRLGVESGSSLDLAVNASEEGGESITLRPKGQEPPLRREGDLLVHTGRLTDEDFDVVDQLRKQHDERARNHARAPE